MIIKGTSDIKGIHGLHLKPGPLRESDALLTLYLLAAEKDHLLKKLQWTRRQKDQTERRLTEIAQASSIIEKRRAGKSLSTPHFEVHSTVIEY